MEKNIEEIEKRFETIRCLLSEIKFLILKDALEKAPDNFYEAEEIKVDAEERILCKSDLKHINFRGIIEP